MGLQPCGSGRNDALRKPPGAGPSDRANQEVKGKGETYLPKIVTAAMMSRTMIPTATHPLVVSARS